MSNPSHVGVVRGIEWNNKDKDRVKINTKVASGIFYINDEEMIEDLEDVCSGARVYMIGRGMFTTKPFCEECYSRQFLLDNNTLHCTACC